jgi:uncharacterized RDD family membrane protein YckC
MFEEEVDWSRLQLPAELVATPELGRPRAHPPIIYAGFARRALAVLVDAPFLLVLTSLATTLAFLAAIGGGMVAGNVNRQVERLALGAALAVGVAVSLAYHVVSWGHGGQTPGKIMVGVQVVRKDGQELGYKRAFLRWVGYLLALLPLGLGLMLVLFHPRKRGLHDLVAGTCVVRVKRPARQESRR